MESNQADAEREMFEDWQRSIGVKDELFERSRVERRNYRNLQVDHDWRVWQAARAWKGDCVPR